MNVKQLTIDEVAEAVKLAQGVFNYCLRGTIAQPESIRFFEDYVTEERMVAAVKANELFMWGIYEMGHMVAMSAMQRSGHITLIYVLPAFQRRGLGKELLTTMRIFARQKLHLDLVTVNAMPEWTANYFYRNKFAMMQSMAQAPGVYTALWAKSSKEVRFETKPVSQGWWIACGIFGVLVCVGVTVGYLASVIGLL